MLLLRIEFLGVDYRLLSGVLSARNVCCLYSRGCETPGLLSGEPSVRFSELGFEEWKSAE